MRGGLLGAIDRAGTTADWARFIESSVFVEPASAGSVNRLGLARKTSPPNFRQFGQASDVLARENRQERPELDLGLRQFRRRIRVSDHAHTRVQPGFGAAQESAPQRHAEL